MELVLLTALGVGGATIFGSLMGFMFKDISHRFSDIVLSFAAGVMLSAAILGLILPSVEYGGKSAVIVTVAGIFAGAVCLSLCDRLIPHLHRLQGGQEEKHADSRISSAKPACLLHIFRKKSVTNATRITSPLLCAV